MQPKKAALRMVLLWAANLPVANVLWVILFFNAPGLNGVDLFSVCLSVVNGCRINAVTLCVRLKKLDVNQMKLVVYRHDQLTTVACDIKHQAVIGND